MGTQQLSEYASREVGSSTIDLSVGQPSPGLLPLAAIRAAAADRLRGSGRLGSEEEAPSGAGTGRPDTALLLQYGPRQGYPSFRKDLAEFLTQRYRGRVSTNPDSIMTTAGMYE